MKNKLLSGAALAGAAALLLLVAWPSYRQGEPSQAGSPAPDFSFELGGKPVRLSALSGKVVVLNFWASWCPPCADEMPSLVRLHQKLEPLGGIVLGVSVDEDSAAYQKFLRDQRIPFPNHRDPSRSIASAYGTAMYPETYILDRAGRIARKIVGPQNWDDPQYLAYLKSLLQTAP